MLIVSLVFTLMRSNDMQGTKLISIFHSCFHGIELSPVCDGVRLGVPCWEVRRL